MTDTEQQFLEEIRTKLKTIEGYLNVMVSLSSAPDGIRNADVQSLGVAMGNILHDVYEAICNFEAKKRGCE